MYTPTIEIIHAILYPYHLRFNSIDIFVVYLLLLLIQHAESI